MTGPGRLRLADRAQARTLETFLGRAARIDPGMLVRLRADARAGTVAAYARLPFGVLAGRTVLGALLDGTDLTVGAADLAAGIAAGAEAQAGDARPTGRVVDVVLPGRRDAQWRGSLPPPAGWRRLDTVPVVDVRGLVAAGVRAFRAAQDPTAGSRAAQQAAEALLGQDALTVSDRDVSVVFPLRVCHAAWRMGFLGASDDADCAVSVSGRWARLAAPFGSTYRDPDGASLLTS